MDWTTLIGPTIAPALIAGAVALFVVWINRKTTLQTHREKLEFDKQLTKEKAEYDRKAADRKLRQGLAEELIAGFYEIDDIMRSVRSPLGYSGEGSTRQKGENETPEETERLNNHFIVHERFNRHRDAYARIMSREYRAVAWFGLEIRRPFNLVKKAVGEVFSANQMLASKFNLPMMTEKEIDRQKKWHNTIWSSYDDEDIIAARLQEALKIVETTCRPVLEQPLQ